MRVQLDRVREESVTWDESIEVDPEELADQGVLAIDAVRSRGEVSFVHPGFLVRARLDYEQTLSCTRWLEPTTQQVHEEIAFVVLTGAEVETEDRELDEDEVNVIRVEGDELDTESIVHEQLGLLVPMKALCSEDCAGLCSQCGALRREGCDCRSTPTDPRWSALSQLKDETA